MITDQHVLKNLKRYKVTFFCFHEMGLLNDTTISKAFFVIKSIFILCSVNPEPFDAQTTHNQLPVIIINFNVYILAQLLDI